MPIDMIKQFLKLESASGMLLIIATILAIFCNNSPVSVIYNDFLSLHIAFHIGQFSLAKPLLLWVNDGLMTIFFLLVGLELKREFLEGELQGIKRISLPLCAALGGIVVPALFFYMFNKDNPIGLNGWAVPTATDIAFALGVLSLFGSRISTNLKLFLMALAIIDDVGAILIIAIFHTSGLSVLSLAFAHVFILTLILLNRFGVRRVSAYLFVGLLLWISVLKSGVHATLAGVIIGFAMPLNRVEGEREPPLRELEEALHPWVAFMIMPLFAFANAGLSFSGMHTDIFLQPVVLGIVSGLFLGKQLGVFIATWLVVKLGLAPMPERSTWLEIYGVSLLCGVGFTMSLFIGSLAYDMEHFHVQVRLGVLFASLLSGVGGYLVIQYALARKSLA